MIMRPLTNPGLVLSSLAPLGLAIVIAAVGGDYFHPLITNEVNIVGAPLGLVVIATAGLLMAMGVLSALSDQASWRRLAALSLPATLLVLFGPLLVIQVIKLGQG